MGTGYKKKRKFKRATAQKHLDSFLERCQEINDSDEYLYRVVAVYVFGSFAKNVDKVGDVDILFRLHGKMANRSDQLAQEKEQLTKDQDQNLVPSHFGFLEQLFWPQLKCKRYMKSGSSILSLHEWCPDAELLKTEPHDCLFDTGEGIES
jgi:predicted nucleotidyltransferase